MDELTAPPFASIVIAFPTSPITVRSILVFRPPKYRFLYRALQFALQFAGRSSSTPKTVADFSTLPKSM